MTANNQIKCSATTHDRTLHENDRVKEYPPPEVGALQVVGSVAYKWNGREWVIA